MMLTLLFLFCAIYIIMISVFILGAINATYPVDEGYRPRVSIIVAARNEEENIEPCLHSLGALDYPKDLLDIIIADDRSTDRTAEIVSQYAAVHGHMRLLRVVPDAALPPGKANAVTCAADTAAGEILMFTDADCTVPPTWVRDTVKYYSHPRIGAVAGFTSLTGQPPLEQMQALDWFVLFSVAAATTRFGFPVTAVGTNLSVRKQAYESVGGYRKIPFSVTEDYALYHAVTAGGLWKARFPMDAGALVQSKPCHTLTQLFGQKRRWFTGGRGMDIKSMLIFAFPYIYNALILVGVFLAPWWAVGIALAVKLIVDLLLCLPAVIRFSRRSLLLIYPLFEVYYYIYVLLFPPLVLFGNKITWKGRKF